MAEKGSLWRAPGAPKDRPLVAWEIVTGCIATGRELWFEMPGFPSSSTAREEPSRADAARKWRRWQRLRRGVLRWVRQSPIRRSDADNAGTHTTDHVGRGDFRRPGGRRNGVGRAWAAGPVAAWAAAVGQPSHGLYHLVPRLPAGDYRPHHGVRVGASDRRHGALQRPGQSGS